MSNQGSIYSGSCLCGAVRYQAIGPLRNVVACHCTQCRKTTGHYLAATNVSRDRLQLLSSKTLTWFRSSDSAERGFCAQCGANLFWRRTHEGASTVSISAGTLDGPTGLKVVEHIFVADKGDYYDLPDNVPCKAGYE